jgi:acyl-coenzyme A thioesterase PaaI-like protein
MEPMISSPEYETIPMWARIPKAGGEDSLFAETLATQSTIPYCLMRRRKDSTPLEWRGGSEANGDILLYSADTLTPPDTITFLALSSPAICSHPSTAHGGIVSTILDEVMSHTLISLFSTDPDAVDTLRRRIFTVKLEVRFRKPVRTPGSLIVRSWCLRKDGRKYYMMAQAIQRQTADTKMKDVVTTEAEGLWLMTNPKL